MKVRSMTKFVAVSAIALATSMYATGVIAASFQIGDAITVGVDAVVENSIDIVIVDVDLGTIGAHNDPTDVATLTLDADGTDNYTDDPGSGYNSADPASIVVDPGDVPTEGEIQLTNAFNGVDLYVTVAGCTDVSHTAPGGVLPENFILNQVFIGTGNATAGTSGADATFDCTNLAAPVVAGTMTTDAGTGAATFPVSVEITTDPAEPGGQVGYNDGTYAGSFDMRITY